MVRGNRTKAGVAALVSALLVVTGMVAAPAAQAEGEVAWQRGPVWVEAPMSLAAAEAELDDNDEIQSTFVSNARCFGHLGSVGHWTGGGVEVIVDEYDGPGIYCTVDVTIEYCYWFFIQRRCSNHYTSLSGTTGPLRVDSTAPVGIGTHVSDTTANLAGWYRTPGRVDWFGYDTGSGMSGCTGERIQGPDTAAKVVFGACYDNVNNQTGASFTYKYDATPPVLAPTVSAPVLLGTAVKGDPGASDATSGVAKSACNGGLDLPTATVGPHTVTCTASDKADNTASADLTYTVVSPSSTSVALSGSSFRFGAAVIATATATVAVDGGPLAGDVAFFIDGVPAGAAPVISGVATASLTLPGGLSAGAHELTATYSGSSTALESSGTAAFTVVAATSATTLSGPPVHNNKQTPGKLSAAVKVEGGLAAIGTVQFRDGSAVMGSASLQSGTAVFTLPSSLSRGTHRFTAVFVPAAVGDIVGSTSNAVSVLVPR